MSGHCTFCQMWHSGSCCHPGNQENAILKQQLFDAQAAIADLQGQVAIAKEGLPASTKELINAKEAGRALQQRVAQLEQWQDGVVKAFVEAPLEWSPHLGRQHIPTSLPQIFRNMKDYADKLATLQADHARVLGLLNGILKRNQGGFEKDDSDIRLAVNILKEAASLPAQRAKLAQGGA